jgi:hypothetical protein
MNTPLRSWIGFFALLGLVAQLAAADKPRSGNWIPLFNGKDLEGWTPKITGYDLGVNFGNTYRVENGILRVCYDQYEKFDGRFGHLYYREKFSNYVIRVEYRFLGNQTPGGPSWAFRNSGIMIHSQPPKTMELKQEFPVCIEVQLLGGPGTGDRTTGNLCSPGTHVVMDGKLITQHCVESKSKTYHGDQWVTIEVEVHGNKLIKHIYEGQTVLSYSQPQLDDTDAQAQKLAVQGFPKMISEGYICLQAESHPVEFRKVELLKLDE